ncbi:hypothetical protein QM312_36765, partial [Burkholderia cenocepacia]|uniref:hypothetical protein n=1 Tax=Burkholderia cenocepacia TaxID=95486 RepID=UPI0024B7C907
RRPPAIQCVVRAHAASRAPHVGGNVRERRAARQRHSMVFMASPVVRAGAHACPDLVLCIDRRPWGDGAGS